jgi:RND family efflux transporter MFP subunit
MYKSILLGLVTLALAAALGCRKEAQGNASDTSAGSSLAADNATPTEVALPVSAAPVRRGDLVLSVSTTGQVVSEAVSVLKAEVTGTVARIAVRAGDRVRRGQLLVAFDPKPLDLAVSEAEVAVEQARVQFRDLTYPDSLVTGRPPTEEQRRVAAVRSGLQAALVRLEKAKLDRERAAVLSPFDGMVDRVEVAPGVRVSPGEPLVRVVDLSQLRVEANVLEHDLPFVREGGDATVSSPATANRVIRGRIVAILPMVDTVSRSGRVYVRLPANSGLRPGMYADVRLEAARLRGRILVPARAIIQRDGRPLVFVVRDGRAQWVYINPGRSNGIETEVLPDSASGVIPVQVGDQVIVAGHITLAHDAPVRVISGDTALSRQTGKG